MNWRLIEPLQRSQRSTKHKQTRVNHPGKNFTLFSLGFIIYGVSPQYNTLSYSEYFPTLTHQQHCRDTTWTYAISDNENKMKS